VIFGVNEGVPAGREAAFVGKRAGSALTADEAVSVRRALTPVF